MAVEATDTPRITTPYELLGGEPGVRALVDRFYDIMDRDPAMAPLRALHAADLAPIARSSPTG